MFESIKKLFKKKAPAQDPHHYQEHIGVSSPYLRNFVHIQVLKRNGLFIAELTTPIGEHVVACEAGRHELTRLLCYAQHVAKWNHMKYECGL